MTHKPRRLARTFWIRTGSIVFVAAFAAAALAWCGLAPHGGGDRGNVGAYSFHTSDLLVDNTSTLSSATPSTVAIYNASKQFTSYAGSASNTCGVGSAATQIAINAQGSATVVCAAAGTGTITGSGTAPDLAVFTAGSAIGNYAGSASNACGAGSAAQSFTLNAAGSASAACAQFVNGTGTGSDLAIFTAAGTIGNYAGFTLKNDGSGTVCTITAQGSGDCNNVVLGAGTSGNLTVFQSAPPNNRTIGNYGGGSAACGTGSAVTSVVFGANGTVTAGCGSIASVAGGFWENVETDTLTGGSLTGWTQKTGAWTATAGVGFSIDDGTTESFLSDDSGKPFDILVGASNASMLGWAVSVEFQYTAGSTAANDCGFVFRGVNAAIGANAVRVFAEKNGTKDGYDTFGAAQNGWSPNPGGAFSNGVWHTLGATAIGPSASWASVSMDGVTVWQGLMDTIIAPTRVGIWGNPGHCLFRNFKIWTMGPAT